MCPKRFRNPSLHFQFQAREAEIAINVIEHAVRPNFKNHPFPGRPPEHVNAAERCQKSNCFQR
jgi:hypothetical protein